MKVVNQIPYHKPIPVSFTIPIDIPKTGRISNGKYVQYLEYKIKQLYDVEYVIACSSCSQGLLITLQALTKRSNFLTINTPAFGWFSSKWAIETASIMPYFVDINKKTWLMKQGSVKYYIALPIHTFGSICEIKGDYVIYDGAHALGSTIKDFGDTTVFSLAPTKLVTSCEGGIIVTNDGDLAREMIKLRDKISRMSELNAVYGLHTLQHLEKIKEWKIEVRNYYKKHLLGIFQEIPFHSNFNTIGYLTLDEIPEKIEYKKYYEPLHELEVSRYVYENIVCLPSWYGVDYKKIVENILEWNKY